jgi:hypothetical protein
MFKFFSEGGTEAFKIMEVLDFWVGGHDLHNQSKWEWVNDDDWRYSNWAKSKDLSKVINQRI